MPNRNLLLTIFSFVLINGCIQSGVDSPSIVINTEETSFSCPNPSAFSEPALRTFGSLDQETYIQFNSEGEAHGFEAKSHTIEPKTATLASLSNSVIMTLTPSYNRGLCTATLIGRDVVMTGAHCWTGPSTTATLGFRFKVNQSGMQKDVFINGDCIRHKDADIGNHINDLALCKLRAPVRGFLGKFETVSIKYGRLNDKEEVLLAGYGCLTQGGSSQFSLATGSAPVTNAASCYKFAGIGKPDVYDENRICTISKSPSAILRDVNLIGGLEGAVLCKGDSGGPLFYHEEVPVNARKVIGVATHVDHVNKQSFFSALGKPDIAAFLEYWASRCGVQVCGVSDDTSGCR